MAGAEKISITICGDGGCGKSSITLRLVRSQWTHEYDPTIEDSYSTTRTVDGLPYFLSLTDTAGQEEYRGLWAASNLKSDAFLLVYDITNVSSLDTLDHFMQMIDIEAEQRQDEQGTKGALPPPVKIVAGNKCDLKDARVVSSRQGLEWARKRGCGFMETSAREMVNIEETFALIVRRVVEARRLQATQFPNSAPQPTHVRGKSSTNTQQQSISKIPSQAQQPHVLSHQTSPSQSGLYGVSRTPALTASEKNLPLGEGGYAAGGGGGGDVLQRYEREKIEAQSAKKKKGFWRTLKCW